MAFDFGSARTGVAVGNRVTGTASPIATVRQIESDGGLKEVDQMIREWQPEQLIIGYPEHVGASTNAPQQAIRRFAEQLRERYGLKVQMVDESLSSAEANKRLKELRQNGRKKRVNKAEIDSIAAAIILERWLEQPHGI